MDNPNEQQGKEYGWPRRLSVGLLFVKSFFSRLVSLFTITEQDLMDAGVKLKRMSD